jgi:hypothetical protein
VILHLTARLEMRAADRQLKMPTAYVYVIEAIGLGRFKIGRTIDFTDRFPAYRTECPVECRPVIAAVVPASEVDWIERALHGWFDAKRIKGEWFLLTETDLANLAGVIREICLPAVEAVELSVRRKPMISSRRALDDDWLQREAEVRRNQARNAMHMDDVILDRVAHAKEIGETIDAKIVAAELRRHSYRSPTHVHEAVRALIRSGELAIVSPSRNPETGSFWFDAYRECDLIIPDVTCTWERTYEGYEIQVSEPLGRTVPEFFGVSRW